ncbi:MAG: S-layer homology domain-containing protein [Cyanobacteriota bacterium]
MKSPTQTQSVELAEQLSVSQMAKDDDKDDKGDDDDNDRDDDDDDSEAVPKSCRDSVYKDVTKQSGIPASQLRIVKAERQTWSNGCLGLEIPGTGCTQAMVPGWRIVVASDKQLWVYRTDKSGSMVKLDEAATRTLASQSITQSTSSREVINRTTQTTQSVTGSASQSSSSQSTQATSVMGSASQTGSTQTMEEYSTGTQQQTRIARRSALVNFTDIAESYWAKDFIMELAQRGIMTGFPDGKFHPNKPVTRAELAALLSSVFKKAKVRDAMSFKDVSLSHWAYNGIQEAYEMGFISAVSGNQFNPNQTLTRLQVMTALMKALGYTSSSSSTAQVLQYYSDAAAIPVEARSLVAAATERGIVANYPNVKTCSPNKVATRAEVAAFLYQAMVSNGEATAISSPYVEKGVAVTEGGQSVDADAPRRRQNCNQGIGNGAEGCDPGNSRPHGGSNDEGGRTPGGRRK